MFHVTVYHNVASLDDHPLRFLEGYEPGQEVTPVFEYKTDRPTPEAACEQAFFLFNVGDDAAFNLEIGTIQIAVDYRARKLRSLSVGDVVKVDDEWFSCAPIGFNRIAEPVVVSGIDEHGTHTL